MKKFEELIPGRVEKRKLSAEEKREYCLAWESSKLNRSEFCKAHGISKSSLQRWCREYTRNGSEDFAPVLVNNPVSLKKATNLRVELCLYSSLRLVLEVEEHQLSRVIQEVSHAASIIR